MADKILRVKIIPDVTELKKAFNKLAIGGAGTGGNKLEKQAREEGTKRSKENTRILGSLKNILKFVSLSAFVASLFAGLIRIMEPVFRLFSVILSLLFLPLIPILKPVLKKLGEFAGALATAGTDFLAGDIDFSEFLGKVADAIREIFLTEEVKTAVFDGLVNLFNELGQFVGENGVAIISGFTKAVIAFLKGLALGFLAFIDGLSQEFNNFGKILVVALTLIVTGIVIAFGGWIALLAVVLGTLAFKLGLKIGEALEKIAIKIRDTWNTFIDNVKGIFDSIIRKIKDFLSGLGGLLSRGGGRTTSVGDAIIRPNGQIIKTDPADTLIATKNPEALGGGGGGQFIFSPTINLNGPIDSELDIRRVAEQIAQMGAESLARKTGSLRF